MFLVPLMEMQTIFNGIKDFVCFTKRVGLYNSSLVHMKTFGVLNKLGLFDNKNKTLMYVHVTQMGLTKHPAFNHN